MHIFLKDNTTERLLEHSYTSPYDIAKRISERIFAMEVDGKRLNISVECLKAAFFTAQREKHLINKPITILYRKNLIQF